MRAFGDYPHALHYALKANSTLAIVAAAARAGQRRRRQFHLGDRASRAAPASRRREIVFTGVGKSPRELERAVPLGLKAINVESAGELARVEAIASAARAPARASRCASIRTSTPRAIRTSRPALKINKFGVPLDEARELLATLARRVRS